MSVSSIGPATATSSTQAELQRLQQQLAADVAAKAGEKVIATDKANVTKAQREAAQQRTGSIVDIDL